jgi:hypothetical protein|tara:strand:+ start:472 stop:657 length:186 start_codon:yes stop_codon:yes gene_type:complete
MRRNTMMDYFDTIDYFNEIDEGYLTPKQFLDYNTLLKLFENELTDNEIWSMTNSNEIKGEN